MPNLRLKAQPSVVADYFRLFVNRRAYTLQSNRPHSQSAGITTIGPRTREPARG